MSTSKNQCEACASELIYDASGMMLSCKHCSTGRTIPTEKPLPKEPYNERRELKPPAEYDTQYACEQCKRHNVFSVNSGISNCPSCGAASKNRKLNLPYQPHAILPFKINRIKAVENMGKWIKKRKFSPKAFKKSVDLEHLHSAYYPTWDYEANIRTSYSGVGVKVHTSRDSKGNTVRRESRHPIRGVENSYREHELEFAVPFENNLDEKLGYFGFDSFVQYQTEFVYGVDMKDAQYNVHQAWQYAMQNMHAREEKRIKASYRQYDRIEQWRATSEFLDPKFSLVYLPLYDTEYPYKGKIYACYQNGFNGHVQGKAPKSFGKIFGFTLLCLTVVGLIPALIWLYK